MDLGELRNVENRMRERFQQELDGLAIFICGTEFADQRGRLSLDLQTYTSAESIPTAFQVRYLRRSLLVLAISVFRSELDALLQPYLAIAAPKTESSITGPPLPRRDIATGGDGVTLLHRLLMVMIFRDGYAIRECSLMLKSRDAVIEAVRSELASGWLKML